MKKIILLVLVVAMLTGCGSLNNISTESEVQIERTPEEKIVDVWIWKLTNNYSYEQLFDTQTINSAEAEIYAEKTIEDTNYYIFYTDDTKIMFTKKLEDYGVKMYVLKKFDNDYKFSYTKEDVAIAVEKICKTCNGAGQVVIDTKQENGRYACSLCNGTGWLSNQYYDAILGWQTNTYGCGGCGAAGWLNGVHTVNIYGKCSSCDGFGVK